ncbi:hypothetical protein A0H81_14777 [Grifola frondosa]|uniref:DUF6534 domain-containing protein n=1 Tax=Grifola frondosa TaxID=5627 RepID=A0A1C7LKI9_GRIFR|nr:hypothetical protein A0H81_14777 [Grifola frondosa]
MHSNKLFALPAWLNASLRFSIETPWKLPFQGEFIWLLVFFGYPGLFASLSNYQIYLPGCLQVLCGIGFACMATIAHMSSEDVHMSFDGTIGALLIGYAATLFLCAVTTAQVVFYLRRIASHGNPFELIAPTWSSGVVIIITETSSLIVRCVYAHRMWKLSRGHRVIPMIVVILSLLNMAIGVAFGANEIVLVSWLDARKFSWTLYSSCSVEIVVDSIIAVSMFILLSPLRTGVKRFDSVIQTLILYSINTGLLTTLFVVVSIVLFIVVPETFSFVAIYFIIGQLYTNALLGTLNSQSHITETPAQDYADGSPMLTSAIGIDAQDPSVIRPGDLERNWQASR